MDVRYVLDTANAVKLELYRYRIAAAAIFMCVTAGVLAFGYLVPKTYTSEALLYADQSSILEPLLRGSAEVTPIDRINEARELIRSRSFLEKLAFEGGILSGRENEEEKNVAIDGVRKNLKLSVSNHNFIELSYSSDSADKSFRMLSAALNQFIERTIREKRAESRNAFEFIDAQVKSYQRQLETAEGKLKEFKTSNQDGTESNVQQRIERLRADIQNLKLEIQQTESVIDLTTTQLKSEEPYRSVTVSRGRSNIDTRLSQMRAQLDSLRLKYHDSHPDIVNLKGQIAELQQQKASGGSGESSSGDVNEVMENPVYQTLKLKLAENQTQLQVQRNRLKSLESLLEQAFDRADRVAQNQAELSDLTRDYTVTKGVYEDMLQRREKARLSMTLDVEGQGVSYRIQEPASYPTRWDGLQLYQVGMAGPFLAGTMVLGLLTVLVMFDNRVRSGYSLQSLLPESIPVLVSIPHYKSTWKDRLMRKDSLVLGGVLIIFLVAYIAVMIFSVMDVQPSQIVAKLSGWFG